MIEKKISYNEPKPTKVLNIKPVKQGGKLNYLGKQKTVTAPVKWKSGPTHPITHLAYITDEEQKVLVKLNMYKSMNGKPNKGPFGLPSLNDGDGSGGGGDSGGGSGGSGGSDASGDAGNATGDSGGVGGSGDSTDGAGAGSGPGGEAGTGGVSGPGPGSPGTEDAVAENAAAVAQAIAEQTVTNPPMEEIEAAPAPVNVVEGLMGLASKAMKTYMAFSPTAIAARAISDAISAANRGVTAPTDYSQVTESVQTSTPGPNNSGGITTIEQYAPLTNTSSGDNTGDALVTRLNAALKTQPNIYGIPSVSPYSNYTLLDLYNNRYI